MSGLKITVPMSFTDTTLPVLRDDPILYNGSIGLYDFTHLASPAAAGVPANNGTIPNIAHAEFAKTINEADTGFALTYTVSGGGLTGAKGLVERTSKGGLHAIPSQVAGNQLAGDGVRLSFGPRVRQYMYDNKGHNFYFSIWQRLTRLSTGAPEDIVFVELGSASNSNQGFILRQNSSWVSQAPGTLQTNTPAAGQLKTLGNQRASAQINAGGGNMSGTPNQFGPIWGQPLTTYNNAVGTWTGKTNAHIQYRMYIEDLTVSGRTYAQVDAIDSQLYTKEVLTAGGRYYGDTFTDPATIP